MHATDFRIDCRGRALDLRPGRAVVMGILNVTPDSFSDGGLFLPIDRALARAEAMLEEGAAVIDVGGESSRPAGRTYGAGAAPVGADEERRRVLPVIERIARELPEAVISIDTYKPEVAAEALDAGAHVVNDITGLRHDGRMAEVVAGRGAALVVVHSRGAPGALEHERSAPTDVVEEVFEGLRAAIGAAAAAGVKALIADPGFGFGKTPAENLRLVGASARLLRLGRPLLIGVSRKATIGEVLGRPDAPVPVAGRRYGSLGAAALAVSRGASVVRTHDVLETVQLLRVLTEAMRAAEDLVPMGPPYADLTSR